MPLISREISPDLPHSKGVWQAATLCICIAFGLSMILNTQGAGDGMWFWYASLFRNGRRLYADLHLALQPLFVLETALFMAAFGKGWLLSKLPAVLHLIAYCFGLRLVLLRLDSGLTDRQKALLLACAFFVSIDFEAYRFDDYHVLSDCFEVYSLAILLALPRAGTARQATLASVSLGILAGLSLVTRLNDGAALLVAVGIGVVCIAPARRLVLLATLAGSSAVTVAVVLGAVFLSGDSLHDYAIFSIFRAADLKGGANSVLLNPVTLPWNTIFYLLRPQTFEFVLYILGSATIWAMLIHPFFQTRRISDFWKAIAGIVAVLLPLKHFMDRGVFFGQRLTEGIAAVCALLLYVLALMAIVRFLRWGFAKPGMQNWNRAEILLLVPLGRLASYSMSSGGLHFGIYGPIGVMVLLLPVASPIQIKQEWKQAFLFAVAAVLLVHCVNFKYWHPYAWHSYGNGPMFIGRQVYRHPDYGPMLAERSLLQFIEPICSSVHEGGDEGEMLSLPFSYPNYFCSIEPWHGYVQTFFDISSKETIDGLVSALNANPPKWIVYQRQMNILTMHEHVYNHDRPLPQRDLDRLIEGKVASGAWQTVYTSAYGTSSSFDSYWILMRTRH